MTNRFEHLQKTATKTSNWQNDLLKNSLPIRAFTNTLTSNLLLTCERMIVQSMISTKKFKSWFSL